MTISDQLIILATVLGPILAVQAQKAVEAFREKRQRKLWVFHTLMATRAARLSPEHVQALNMIDLAFYGQRILGIKHRSKQEQSVLDSWREYLDQLTTKFDDGEGQHWQARGDELFVNILHAIASDVDFTFDRVQLKKGVYSPVAHGKLEEEQDKIRRLAIEVLSGETPLTMNVASFPVDPNALRAHLELQQALLAALTGRAALSVKVAAGE